MITWRLNEKHADYIMNVLAARPYGEVSGLIQELLRQANTGPMVGPQEGPPRVEPPPDTVQ